MTMMTMMTMMMMMMMIMMICNFVDELPYLKRQNNQHNVEAFGRYCFMIPSINSHLNVSKDGRIVSTMVSVSTIDSRRRCGRFNW